MKALLAILTLLTINSSKQQWNDYKFDDNLTLSIPDNFVVIDTLGQHIIRAQIDNAIILIQRMPNKGKLAINIDDKDELLENYTRFRNGFVGSQRDKLISKEFVEKDGLQLMRFAYYVTLGEERQIRHSLCIFISENWYVIQFWEVEAMTTELLNERETLFSSVKFSDGLSLKNQMSNSDEGSQAYKIGYLIGDVFGYILMFVLVTVLVVWISRKVRR